MPKHAVEAKDEQAVQLKQGLYDQIFRDILGLKKKVMEWWKYSLESKLVCNGCIDDRPKKLNAEGFCAWCAGTGYVPDKDQRNVAFKEALARLSPAPKAVEMRIDDNRDKEELMNLYKGKSKEEVDALLEKLNIPIKGEVDLVTMDDNGNDGS